MPDPDSVVDGHLARVLSDFVLPAAAGPSRPFESVGAHHVRGEPVSAAEAMRAGYEPISAGEPWGPAWSTTWFRLEGRVPADWDGREVALRFEIGGAGETGFGAEALVWHDGRPVQGLSPNHTEYVVTRMARAGEPVELYVEAAANPRPPWGAATWPRLSADPDGPPLFTLACAELRTVDRTLRAFADDYRVLLGLVHALPRSDPWRGRARQALEAAARELDLDEVRATVPGAWRHLRSAFAVPSDPGPHRISAVGHAHLDTAWLWPLRETVRKCARTFSTAVRLMDDYPDYTFACSQALHLAWVKDRYPQLWEAIQAKVATGQFEPTGCMWVESDCNLPSGESLVRQIVYGKRFYLDQFGVEARGAWLPDTFGFSAALPQILREGGVEWFFTQKLSWNQDNELPHHSFAWEGIDGSRVVRTLPTVEQLLRATTVTDLVESVRRFKDSARANRSLYPYGYGDGGGGPTAGMLETLRRVANLDGVPGLALEGPQAFFDAAAAEADDWPVWVGELYLELHRGTYTTHADVKLANRRAEVGLRDAELSATVASLSGHPYPQDSLERAWKTLLTHQFHDILPGAGIRWVYEDAARDHAAVLGTVASVVHDATEFLARSVNTDSYERPTVVFNTTSHDRVGLVELDVEPVEASRLVLLGASGDRSPIQVTSDGRTIARVQVPACGYATYDLVEGRSDPLDDLQVDLQRLENERLKVAFDENGLIASIYDKHAGREVLAPNARANLLQLHDDHPNFFDAWDVDRFAFDSSTDIVDLDDLAVIERGPLRATLQVDRRFGNSHIRQLISLSVDSAQLTFLTEVDWHESHRFLKVAFPVAVHSPAANYEIQFGCLSRPTHASTSWDRAKFEVWAHQWADLSEGGDYGVALLNDCKYGYDIRGNVLRLSLLRSPTWPDPEADRGFHRFTYALLPHSGDLRAGGVIEEARELNTPMRAVAVTSHTGERDRQGSFVRVDQPGIVIEAVKRADRGPGLVVRVAEVWGRRTPARLRLPRPATGAWRADLLERDVAALSFDGAEVLLFLRPFEVVTVRAEVR